MVLSKEWKDLALRVLQDNREVSKKGKWMEAGKWGGRPHNFQFHTYRRGLLTGLCLFERGWLMSMELFTVYDFLPFENPSFQCGANSCILRDTVSPRRVYSEGLHKSIPPSSNGLPEFLRCMLHTASSPHPVTAFLFYSPNMPGTDICVISWTASILRSPVSWASHVAQQQSWVQEFGREGRRDKNNSCIQNEGGEKYA